MKKLLLNIGILLLCITLSNCGSDTSPDKWEQKKLEVQEIQRQAEIATAEADKALKRAISRKVQKAQRSFAELSGNKVDGKELKQLRKDLVDSGIISKEVFDLASEDGVVTYEEMKILISTIKGLPDLTPNEMTEEEERELEQVKKLFQSLNVLKSK